MDTSSLFSQHQDAKTPSDALLSSDDWLERSKHFGKYHLTFQELACLERAIALDPLNFNARRHEIYAFYWIRHEGRLREVFGAFFNDLQQQQEALGSSLFYFYHQEMLSLYFFYLYSLPELSDVELLKAYQQHLQVPVQTWQGPWPEKHYPTTVTAHKLRVAYSGREFDKGSCLQLLRPMLQHHTDNIEIYIYDDSPRQSDNSLEPLVTQWRYTLNTSNRELIDIIRADAIDILVDVAGPTFLLRNEIFWERVAPVQVGGLGFLFSSGKRLDYCLSDRFLTPPELAVHYPEQVKYIPNLFTWETPPELEAVLPEHEGIVLGSANSLNKTNLQVIEVWSEILKQIPHATLFLKNSRFNDRSTREMYVQLFAHFGITESRLRLEKGRLSEPHLTHFYNQIDIALDPFPYQGAITTCDALWMGVPVISLRHPPWQGRALGAALLDQIGLSDCVATTTEDYIAKVVALADNAPMRREYKHSLRDLLRHSILCQPEAFSLSLENAYFEMYQAMDEKRREQEAQ
jgi:protein O-GlcNAc transferase